MSKGLQPSQGYSMVNPPPAVNQQHSLPAVNQQHSLPAVNQQHSLPAVNQQHSLPAVNQQHSLPAVNQQHLLPAVNQQHSLPAGPARHQEARLPNYNANSHALLDQCQPECNLLIPAPVFADSASSSMSAANSENGAMQDIGFCIVCGYMQNKLVSHMAGHSKEDMIMALMNKSKVSPFHTTVNQTPVLNNQPPVSSRIYPSFSLATQTSSSSSVNSRDGSCQQTSDNAAVAAAALLHLGGNLSEGATRMSLNHQESRNEFSSLVNMATSSASAVTVPSNASALHAQPPPDYHQHHHTRLISQSIPSNPQESCSNYDRSYLLAAPQSHETGGNNPSVYSSSQCNNSMQGIQSATRISLSNSIPISASHGTDQESMSSILSVVPHSPLLVMQNNVAGQAEEVQLSCTEMNISPQRQEQMQRGTVAVRPRYQLVQSQPQLQATVTRGAGGSIPVIARPAVPVKYIVLNNNGSKLLSPLATNVRLNSNYFIKNSGTLTPVQTPIMGGNVPNVQVTKVNQVAGVVQSHSDSASPRNQVLLKMPSQQGISSTSSNRFFPQQTQLSAQPCARTQLCPNDLGESRTINQTLNLPPVDPKITPVPSGAKIAGVQPPCGSRHTSTPGTSGMPGTAAQETKALTTVHVGSNITIFVPKDMADKKERLQQIINEELVRGILLNDSKEVTVETSMKCGNGTESHDSVSSNASRLHVNEPGPSKLPANKKNNQMKVGFFEDFWNDELSHDNENHENAFDRGMSVANASSIGEVLPSNTISHTTHVTTGNHNACIDPAMTSVHAGLPSETSGCSIDSSVVNSQERIFLKDSCGDDCVGECHHSDEVSLAPSDPLSLLNVECSEASIKDTTILCDDSDDHQVLPVSISNNEETFVTSFTNLIKQGNSGDLDGVGYKERARPYDSPFTSGSSSFRVMSLGDVESREDNHISRLGVKVKQDEQNMEEDRLLFSPASMMSTSTEGPPPEEDLSLRTAETLADSDSEHGPVASRASCLSGVDEEHQETPASGMAGNFYQHTDHCLTDPASVLHLTMDASESLATSEVLLANLSSEESGSLPPHPHECASPLLHRTQPSPKQYRRSSRRSHSSLSSMSSSSTDSLSSCQSSNSPMDLRNAPLHSKGATNFTPITHSLAAPSHALPDTFSHRPSTEDSIFGPSLTSFGYPPSDPSTLSSTSSKRSDDLMTPCTSSYLPLDASKCEPHAHKETALPSIVSANTDPVQPRNLHSKGQSSGRDAANAGVVLNLDSCTVLPPSVNFSQWFPTSTSSSVNQRQPSLNHQPDVSANHIEPNPGLCFSNSDILKNISSYLSPRDAGTSAAAPHFEDDNGALSSLDTSLNLGAEFALPYDDVGLVVMSPSRSPSKNESPKKVHHSPRVMMNSPQPSTSGVNKRPCPSYSAPAQEAEYEFDYDSDCYADSDCELQGFGRSSLPLEQWKCHQCNKMFKSLKEKLLHAGKHSPSCVGSLNSSVGSGLNSVPSWHRAAPGPAKLASEGAKCPPVRSTEDVKPFPSVKRENVKTEPVLESNFGQPEAGAAYREGFVEGDLNLKKLKTLEACRTEEAVFKCPECFTQFPCADDLLNHRKKVLSAKNFCPLCHQEFRTRTARSSHIKTSHSVREYNCAFCYMSYKSLSNWRRHQLVHLGIVPFECSRCGKRFTRRFEFLQHERVHTGEKPFGCVQCPKTFANESNLRRHIFTHSDDQQTKCDTCDKPYKNARTLMKHKLAAHPVPGKILKIQRDFICSFENCGLVFPSTKKLLWHQEIHQRWPKRCEFCQERFVHKSNLVKHIRQKHDAQYQQEEDGNRPCPICFKVFLKTSLPQHMRIHSGAKPYKCYMCNKKFRVKCNLDAHMYVHSGKRDRPYKCSLCVRSFCRDKDLEAHIRSHKNIRPFTCNECGKSFIHKNNLTAHVAQHSGRKEHTCMYCAKTFFRKYNLRNHERVHTGETPYSCPICGKTFSQKSNYNVHRKSFHVDRHPVHEEI
ncbi:Zinc finger C2H2-type [Trinorchestia longiramus]|nr:Zinc finger C2H2-type [Trinorchestia longiramus]